MNRKKAWVLLAVLILLPAGTLRARTIWMDGRVTRAAWTEKHRYLAVGGARYTLMPGRISITERFPEGKGRWSEAKRSLDSIRRGERVKMRVQGRRIYQIIIVKE